MTVQRALITLRQTKDIDAVCRLVRQAPSGSRVEITGPCRSLDQNAKMWAMLTDISRSKPDGRVYTPDQWKVIFLHALGREVQLLPVLEGAGFVPYGGSSGLSKAEMSEMIEMMHAWGAQHGVVFNDVKFTDEDHVEA